ncbi:MAG: hypothetical protein CM15mP127_02310 [Gammaproteobacteria bacterium]|nr:MAG: hypothetical protein CM15mP127_02310 [Gammaproteobacteria bacterium]
MISSELENALLVYGVRVEQMDLEAKAFDQDGKQTMLHKIILSSHQALIINIF